MRTIKYRGKSFEGKWVYGDLITQKEESTIFIATKQEDDLSFVKVQPESIGQFTGVFDGSRYTKEGEEVLDFQGEGIEVWEHDIIKIPTTGNSDIHGAWAYYEVLYRNGTWIAEYLVSEKGQVLPSRFSGGILLNHTDYTTKEIIDFDRTIILYDIFVIGNTIDHMDLAQRK